MIKVYNILNEKILNSFKEGVVPWVKNWSSVTVFPTNLHTKKRYKGINFMLLSNGRSSFFATYKQTLELKGQVKKGAKSFPVFFRSPITKEGDKEKEGKKGSVWIFRYYNVFDAMDIEGVELPQGKSQHAFNSIDNADQVAQDFVSKHNVKLEHGSNKACFSPDSKIITMPKPDTFKSSACYYKTLFHEMSHCAFREMNLKSESYDMEESIVELSACYLLAMNRLDSLDTIENSASYIANWTRLITSRPNLFAYVSGKASRIADFIMNEQNEKDVE